VPLGVFALALAYDNREVIERKRQAQIVNIVAAAIGAVIAVAVIRSSQGSPNSVSGHRRRSEHTTGAGVPDTPDGVSQRAVPKPTATATAKAIKTTHPPHDRPSRNSTIAALSGTGLAVCLMVAGIAFAYREYVEVADVPEPRADPGEVLLFLDRPGISAYLEALVVPLGYEETEIRYSIQLESGYQARPTEYSLVIMGDAQTRELYPNGDPSAGLNGCWATVWASPDDDLECRKTSLTPGSINSIPELQKPAQVLSGTIESAQPWAVVRTSTTARFVEEAGKRRYFALPAMGTTYVPTLYRDEVTLDVGDGRRGYVPRELDIGIDFGELSQADRLENVAPEPLPGALAWVELDVSLLRARGSIVNTVVEEQGQRTLFLVGVYAGLAASILPILVSLFVAAATRTRRRVTHRPTH
jgi:hypothetical protein